MQNGDNKQNDDKTKASILTLPYRGKVGEHLAKALQKYMNTSTKEGIPTKVIFGGEKLSSKFNNKDLTKTEHLHNIVYEVTCPTIECGASHR